MEREPLEFHFWVLSNRMLMLLDRMLLHCAAIEIDGQVCLFCGRRGAGKSTLSIHLARNGANLLAEDHVILRWQNGEYFVSGCTSRVRVTGKTEEYFLKDQLNSPAVDLGGVFKKDFPAERFYTASPYRDHRPDLLFMSRVGDSFSVAPLARKDALVQMMGITGEMLRFSNRHDYQSFLDPLAGLVASVPTFSLELSPDLSQLSRFDEWWQVYQMPST